MRHGHLTVSLFLNGQEPEAAFIQNALVNNFHQLPMLTILHHQHSNIRAGPGSEATVKGAGKEEEWLVKCSQYRLTFDSQYFGEHARHIIVPLRQWDKVVFQAPAERLIEVLWSRKEGQ